VDVFVMFDDEMYGTALLMVVLQSHNYAVVFAVIVVVGDMKLVRIYMNLLEIPVNFLIVHAIDVLLVRTM
jgi:hypothetical protein